MSILWFLVSAHSSQDTSQDTSQDPLLIMRSAAIALALASSASAQQLSPGCAEDMAVILNKSGNISAWNGKLTKGYSATFDARMQQCAASKKPCPASKKRPAGWSCCTVDVKKYYVDHAADVHQLSLALRRTPHSGGTNTSVGRVCFLNAWYQPNTFDPSDPLYHSRVTEHVSFPFAFGRRCGPDDVAAWIFIINVKWAQEKLPDGQPSFVSGGGYYGMGVDISLASPSCAGTPGNLTTQCYGWKT